VSLQAGDSAPPILTTPFPDSDGVEHVLANLLRQGPLLIGIYKSSCGASKAMMPILNRFVDRYGVFGLQVAGIAQDSANVTRSFIRRSGGFDYPVLIEGDEYPVSIAFDIFATPTIYLIRQDGTIAFTTMGFLRVQLEEISRAVAEVLGVAYQPIIHGEVDEEIPLFVPG
jgi:thiol-disulfide isomerase/thioredoxin